MDTGIQPLSDSELFGWGAVGALLSLAIAQVLPSAIRYAHGSPGPTITAWRVVGFFLVFVIFCTGGGVAAMVVGDATELKQALAYGLAWQSILGGLINGGRAAAG